MSIQNICYNSSKHTICIVDETGNLSKYTFTKDNKRKEFIHSICRDFPDMDVPTWNAMYMILKDWESWFKKHSINYGEM